MLGYWAMDLVKLMPKRRKVPKRILAAWRSEKVRKAKPQKRVDYVAQYADKMASRAKWTAHYSKGKR